MKPTTAIPSFATATPSVAANLPNGWTVAPSIAEAEFISLPRPRDRCRFSNLSRTTLCELLDRGVIKGVTIRRPGATRGKRLIVKKSLADYLYSLADVRPSDITRTGTAMNPTTTSANAAHVV